MKKILLSLGVVAAVASPVVLAISCGGGDSEKPSGANPDGSFTTLTYSDQQYKDAVTFSGTEGSGIASIRQLSNVVISVSQVSGLRSNQNVTITVRANTGYAFDESGNQTKTLTKQVTGLTPVQTVRPTGGTSTTQQTVGPTGGTSTTQPTGGPVGQTSNTQSAPSGSSAVIGGPDFVGLTPNVGFGTYTTVDGFNVFNAPTRPQPAFEGDRIPQRPLSGASTFTKPTTVDASASRRLESVMHTFADDEMNVKNGDGTVVRVQSTKIALPGDTVSERMSVDHFGKFTLVATGQTSGKTSGFYDSLGSVSGLLVHMMGPIDSLPKKLILTYPDGRIALMHTFSPKLAIHPTTGEQVWYIDEFIKTIDLLSSIQDATDANRQPPFYYWNMAMAQNNNNDIRSNNGQLERTSGPTIASTLGINLIGQDNKVMQDTYQHIQPSPYIVPASSLDIETFGTTDEDLTGLYTEPATGDRDNSIKWSYYVDSRNSWYLGYDTQDGVGITNPANRHPMFNQDGTRITTNTNRW